MFLIVIGLRFCNITTRSYKLNLRIINKKSH